VYFTKLCFAPELKLRERNLVKDATALEYLRPPKAVVLLPTYSSAPLRTPTSPEGRTSFRRTYVFQRGGLPVVVIGKANPLPMVTSRNALPSPRETEVVQGSCVIQKERSYARVASALARSRA